MYSPPTENRGLALSNTKGGTSRSKKLDQDAGVYTKVGRYLFRDSKGILRVAKRVIRLTKRCEGREERFPEARQGGRERRRCRGLD